MSPARLPGLAVRTAITLASVATVFAQSSTNAPARIALYAGVGEELIAFGMDVERAALSRQSAVTLPGFVQEAWASSQLPILYVAWSNGGVPRSATLAW